MATLARSLSRLGYATWLEVADQNGSACGPVIVPVFKTGERRAILSLVGSTPTRFRQFSITYAERKSQKFSEAVADHRNDLGMGPSNFIRHRITNRRPCLALLVPTGPGEQVVHRLIFHVATALRERQVAPRCPAPLSACELLLRGNAAGNNRWSQL